MFTFKKQPPQPQAVHNAPNSNPAALSFDELLKLKRDIDGQVAKRSAIELEHTKSRLQLIASSLGQTVAQVFGLHTNETAKKERRKTSIKPKYTDAHGNTWTGRGRRPQWVDEWLRNGSELDALLIEKKA